MAACIRKLSLVTWTGHLYSTAVQLPVVKWWVCMQGELLYQSINLWKNIKVLSEKKVILSSELVVDCHGIFWKQEWVGIRTSVQATSVSPCRGAWAHTDTRDAAQCLGEKLVWTTKPCAFCFLRWWGCFPTSSGANLISVRADTWLMRIIMQGITCQLQGKQTSRHSSWVLGKDLNPFLSH